MFALLLTVGLCSLTQDWPTYTFIEGGFSIRSPGELAYTMTPIETDLGTLQYHSYYLNKELEDGGSYVFLVQYYKNEVLEELSGDTSLAEFFDATIDQSAASLGGTVVIKDEIKHRNLIPGRFWRLHYNGGRSVMKTQSFVYNDTFYLVQVATESTHSLSSNMDRFFDGFRIL